jgi:hypothetical protein
MGKGKVSTVLPFVAEKQSRFRFCFFYDPDEKESAGAELRRMEGKTGRSMSHWAGLVLIRGAVRAIGNFLRAKATARS